MTLESLLTEIAEAGFLVNNLFQREDHSWQANLRSADGHTAFAYGHSALDALALCLDLLEEVEAPIENLESYSISSDNETKANLREVLGKLIPKQKMNRRI